MRFSSLILLLALPVTAQQPRQNGVQASQGPDPLTPDRPETPARVWYAGDTHEHLQTCSGNARPIEEILDRMTAEQLQVASVLVWGARFESGFTSFVCLVQGEPDANSSFQRILQYGVETSGLDCGKWGHLTGLGFGPDEARIAFGALALGDCADMSGLGLGFEGGDGTGALNSCAAERFYMAPGSVCGYAHSIWPLGLYRSNGYDWQTNLVASGFTTDARCLDPEQPLAIPNLFRLIEDGTSVLAELQRSFFPLLGAVDAVLGEAQFFETTVLAPAFPVPFNPPGNWHGLYYKLLSAGLRVSIAGGSDSVCVLGGVTEFPQTHVWLDEPLTYGAWTRGLAAGRTTLGVPGLRLDLRVKEKYVGEEVHLDTLEPAAAVNVEIESATALDDCVELIIDGEVAASLPVTLATGGTTQLSFGAIPFKDSAWVAARLCSQRAHTAAVYVIHEDRPIGDCNAAEYWMLWCDIVAKKALESPQLAMFGTQEGEALGRIARARRAFKSYRDLDGFDPAWTVERYGRSTAGCRGPIAIGTNGPAASGQSLLLTCVNAPPEAEGVVYLSRAQDTAGTCDGDVRLLVRTDPGSLVGTFPAHSTRSGYAEALIPSLPTSEPFLHAQFVWTNPPGCASVACGGGAADRSASDGLRMLVQAPILASIAVTPIQPSIALGTSAQFTAMGTFEDGSTQDLTATVTWSSSSASVATISNAPGSQGLASSAAVGVTTISATDFTSGIGGATTLTVTSAVLSALEVTPTNASIALGTSAQFTATGIFSDSTTQDLTGSVAWSSSDAGVAGVSNAPGSRGFATSLSVGSTSISATDLLRGISGATTLTVTPAVLTALEVTPTNPSIALGTSAQFTATGIYSDDTTQELTGSVTWSSANMLVALVSNAPGSAGLASSVSVGVTSIAAIDPESGISGATTLTVTPAVLTALEVTPTQPSLALGTTQQFTATGIYSDNTTQDLTDAVTWSSAIATVAAISNAPGSAGLATSLSVGATSIAATDPESKISGATTLTVTPAVVVAVEVTPTQPSIPLGTIQQFTATGIYSDSTTQDLTGAVTWSSSRASVAAISNAPGSQGLATSVSIGGTTIAATEPESGISGATLLTVSPAVAISLAVLPADSSIPLGTTQQFAALVSYSDGTTQDLTGAVTWSSSSVAVATISNALGSLGFATSVSVGETTIGATDSESGISGTTTLTVTPAVVLSVAVLPADPAIPLGTTQQFTALATYSDGTTQDLTTSVTWSSSSAAVAEVSNAPKSQGLATSVSIGQTTIAASEPKSGISGATTLTVTPAVVISVAVSPADPAIPLGTSQQFTALATYSDGTTQDLTTSVTWSSSSAAVAEVSNALGSQGLATSVSVGKTTIAATDPESGISGATTLTVTPPVLVSIAVTPSHPTIPLGTSRQFAALGTYSDGTSQDLTTSVTWSSSRPAVATISNAPGSEGLATSVSAGVTTLTATDLASGISGATTLTVRAVLLSIQVTPANPAILVGRTKQFTALGTYNDGSTQNLTAAVTWSSSLAAVATISNSPGTSGLANGVAAGLTTITATDPESAVNGATTLRVLGN